MRVSAAGKSGRGKGQEGWDHVDGQQLLTVPQVAEALNLSKAKIWALVSSGRIRSVKIDASRRVPVEAVDEFVASLTDKLPVRASA
jgi:excisionase family DNA binding protein